VHTATLCAIEVEVELYYESEHDADLDVRIITHSQHSLSNQLPYLAAANDISQDNLPIIFELD